MDIFFYKIKKETELGQKLSELLDEMVRVEHLADSLADTYGAKEYYMDPEQDAGGIVALEFPENHLPSSQKWNQIQIGDNPKCYVPNVRIREELMESAKANAIEGSNYHVSQLELPFEKVQFRFSREEAAQMAGVILTTPSLERIGKRNQIERRLLNMLSMGVPVEQVLPNATEELQTEIRLSLTEDKQIQDAMSGRMFKLVHSYEGPEEAIEIYKQWLDLPVVPFGTVNHLLGVKCDTHRCGILEEGEWMGVTSKVEIMNDALTPCTLEEFKECFPKNAVLL